METLLSEPTMQKPQPDLIALDSCSYSTVSIQKKTEIEKGNKNQNDFKSVSSVVVKIPWNNKMHTVENKL